MRQTLKKYERLHGKSTVDRLFSQGQSLFLYPFVIYYLMIPSGDISPTCSVLFTVSKRKIRHATQRNLLKRRMREAFRKNKNVFYKTIPGVVKNNMHLAFVYINTEIFDYSFIEGKIVEASNLIALKIKHTDNQ